MMVERQQVSLGEVVDILTGNPFKSSQYVEGDENPKLLRGDNIAQGNLRWENVKRWPSNKVGGLEKYALRSGDVVLAMDRPWIDAGLKYGCLAENDLPAFLVQRVARLRGTNKLRTDFLRYLIGSKAFTNHVLGVQTGTAIPHISGIQIKSFEFDLPTLQKQRDIASILGAFDDKIELNRRMNETLEEMARALFRDWFVDFGPTRRQMAMKEKGLATDSTAIMGHAFPPDKAATLAPLFPAKLGENGLPEGWAEMPLDLIGQFLNGLALQKYPAQIGKPDLPVIKIAELRSGVTAKSNRASTEVPEKYVICNGDFIFSWSGSLLAKFWTGGTGALNQHLFKVTSESHPMWFVSEWVQTHLEEFQRIAASKAVTMGHIKRSHLSEAICICPPDESMNAFGNVFAPLISKQIANDEENQILAKMRDLLLPKLMTGEIRLKDMETVKKAECKQSNVIFATDMFGDKTLTPEQEAEREVVVVAANVNALQSDDLLVGNVRLMKANYLIHRRMGWSTSEFERRAAGPHCKRLNDEVREIARQRSWIRQTTKTNAKGKSIPGNRPASKYSEVKPLIAQYGLNDALTWLREHFNGASREWMECVATVDEAILSLTRQSIAITVETIKADIASTPEWKPKLSKPNFSDSEISRAIRKIQEIF